MSEGNRQINVVNIASGICFVALGILLLLQRAGTIEMRQIIELWPLVLVIVGAAIVIQASRGGSLSGSGACAGWLFWVVVLGFVFSHTYDRRAAAEVLPGEGTVTAFNVIGGAREAPEEGVAFVGGTVTNVMGGTGLDLTRASLAPGQTAIVDLFVAMGGVEIRVPPDWQVDLQTTTVVGGIKDERDSGRGEVGTPDGSDSPDDGAGDAAAVAAVEATGSTAGFDDDSGSNPPRLLLTGTVFMGGVVIK